MKAKTLTQNKVNIITLGCSKNLVDSEMLSGQLLANEIDVVHENKKLDHNIVVVNTCGFIDKAKEESVNTILEQVALKKKGKLEKAKKRYEKAQALLVKSNKKKPLQANTLNYLGFTTRKLGDYENGEKYYLLGLEINPNHVGINEYLGELYVATNRLDLAKERLKILESCNCEEYTELKEVIDGTKKSKY